MKTGKHLSNISAGIFALFLLLTVGLACSFNTGTSTSEDTDKKSDTTKKSALSNKKPSGAMKKKADTTKNKSGTSEKEDEGDFVPVYSEVENETFAEFNKKMKDQKVLEEITDSLNAALSLPSDIKVTFKDCGQVNAWYQPGEQKITMCYEFMDMFYQQALKMGRSEEEANDMMFGATTFFFLHELGHGLIDVLKLPATGREEDSVDQLSAYILMDEEDEFGESAAGSGVLIFHAMAEDQEMSANAFADEHSLNSQRAYNLACWMYGKNQEKYSFFVQDGLLTEARAPRCPTEYQKMSSAWQQLVDPWLKK